MENEDHKYKIAYSVELTDGATEEELSHYQLDPGVGGCDCLVIASIIGQPGGPGSLSTAIITVDGHTKKDLTPEQQFQIWNTWAQALVEQLPKGPRRDICMEAFNATKAYIKRQR